MPVTSGGEVSIRAQHPSISSVVLSSGSSTSQPWGLWEAGQAELLLGVGHWGRVHAKDGWLLTLHELEVVTERIPSLAASS